MKRWLFRIVLCLLLGVVTTVGVAFAAAHWVTGERTLSRGLTTLEKETMKEIFGVSDRAFESFFFDSTHKGTAATWRFYNPHHRGTVYMTGQFGWPFVALGYERTGRWADLKEEEWSYDMFRWFKVDTMSDSAWRTRMAIGRNITNASRPVPDTVHPKGLAFNTLFYGTIWYILLFGLTTLVQIRGNIRRRRGRCLKCGYDLRGTPGGSGAGCSECGWGRDAVGEFA